MTAYPKEALLFSIEWMHWGEELIEVTDFGPSSLAWKHLIGRDVFDGSVAIIPVKEAENVRPLTPAAADFIANVRAGSQ